MLAGRRGPIVVGVGAAVLVLLLVFFLVLPKMSQVTEAQDTLSSAESEQTSLESQLQALQQAEVEAPEARATIEDVDRKIPLVADLPGLILLLNNAASKASVSLLTITPATPVADPTTGLSSINVSVTAEGSYFAITEFMFNVETLPRAAKVLTLSLAPGATDAFTTVPTLSATGTMVLYTQDTSAGPGSAPGPDEAPAGATGSAG